MGGFVTVRSGKLGEYEVLRNCTGWLCLPILRSVRTAQYEGEERRNSELKTQNPELNPEPRTQNPEPRTQNSEPRTQNSELTSPRCFAQVCWPVYYPSHPFPLGGCAIRLRRLTLRMQLEYEAARWSCTGLVLVWFCCGCNRCKMPKTDWLWSGFPCISPDLLLNCNPFLLFP
jgi:hypothetical protein